MAGIKNEIMSTVFVGQSDIVVFDEVSDYKTATFSTVTAAGESVGQVSGDSSEYAGEDVETENWVDEQGDIITSTTKAGTVAIKFNMADMSADKIATFLKGTKLEGLTSTLLSEVKNAVGFGVDLPVMTRPLGWFNDEANRCLFLPKAKIVSSLSYDSGRFTINATATAEYINNATLKTAMLFDAKPVYEKGEATPGT
ncbi:hypothetical protein [uncultured Bacteroides sp.]|uniref:hypothetical protein n=1 Tax=uncultured Bacteroides sp. TaxID=162156 RepID=UPI00260FDE39|nr:hypothetical protein [uncultured Bacteroides sp.]